LDAWENEAIPKVSVDCNALFFDQLEYKTRQRKIITVTNTGQVAATFRFVPKLEDDYMCKSWLTLTPPFSMLLPTESVQVTLEANIDSTVANELNFQQDVLDDILIMRLENGRDYFITVSGAHVHSCFGSSIEHLLAADGSSHVPKEVWRLVDALYTSPESMNAHGLFVESGSREELANIRRGLDGHEGVHTGSTVSPQSLAESLLELLDSLADTVVPASFYDALSTLVGSGATSVATWSEKFLSQLPTMNHNLFVYLVTFLKELLEHSERNHLNSEILSHVFSSAFVRSSYNAKRDEKSVAESRKGMRMCLKYFLEK
jgi:phosphatidylinositol-bisphosphatase